MCGRRTISRFLGLLTTGLGICIAFAAELKVKPGGAEQSQPAAKGFVLTCLGEAPDTSLFSDMKWIAPNKETIELRPSSPVEVLQQEDNQLALIFKNPTTEESGVYECTALYSKTDKLNISVALTFYQDITWVDCPSKQALVINTTGNIRCKVSANPSATVTWSKDNKPLPEDHYVIVENGVTVTRTREEDAGNYAMRAMVIQTGRFQNKLITVEVHVPPVITQLESHVEFKEGEEATLTCHATGSPQPEYTWFDPKHQDLSNIHGYFVGKDTGTLTIRSVKKEDAGRYGCTAKNDAGETSKFLELTVIVKPEIKQFDNISVAQGKTATLECQATGEPLPSLSVRKDGHDTAFSKETDDRVSLKTKEEDGKSILTMTIQSIMRSDDGLYYCSAENKGDKVERVGHLTVEFSPIMSKTPVTLVKTWNNNPINLTCIAEAIPNATLTWWFKGQEIKEGDPSYKQYGTSSHSLLLVKPIKELGRDVYGQYRCEATNKHGKKEINIELKEARKPSPVSKVILLKKTATTATFALHNPDDDGGLPIHTFVVEYRETKEPEESKVEKEWNEGSSYILENLKPRVQYTFRFAARNDAGIGEWSQKMDVTMPAESSPESPKFLIPGGNVSRYPDKFEIRWTLPLDNGRKIDYFQLRYFQVTKDGNDWTIIGKAKMEEIRNWNRAPRFELKSLNPNSYYKVEVRAHNEIGFSQDATIVFRTAAGRDLGKEGVGDGSIGSASSLPMAAMVAIIVILLIIVLVTIDITCYLRYQWGLLYFFRSTLCGKSATGDKAKEAAAEDGKGGCKDVPANNGDVKVEPNSTTPMDKGANDKEEKSRTEVDNPAFDAKDTKTDTNSMDVKNISPKGSKSSIAKDSLV
uniref:Fasciclin-2 n=1 Tax=Hadrurus spadix TaxID=141984 RepID=A0A1W7RAL5_9SCOR